MRSPCNPTGDQLPLVTTREKPTSNEAKPKINKLIKRHRSWGRADGLTKATHPKCGVGHACLQCTKWVLGWTSRGVTVSACLTGVTRVSWESPFYSQRTGSLKQETGFVREEWEGDGERLCKSQTLHTCEMKEVEGGGKMWNTNKTLKQVLTNGFILELIQKCSFIQANKSWAGGAGVFDEW